MVSTKAQQRAVNKYNAKAYDRLNIVIPKGMKVDVDAYAKARGTTLNALVNQLLRQEMGLTEAEWKAKTEE